MEQFEVWTDKFKIHCHTLAFSHEHVIKPLKADVKNKHISCLLCDVHEAEEVIVRTPHSQTPGCSGGNLQLGLF